MRVSLTTGGDDLATVEVSADMRLADLAALVAIELSAMAGVAAERMAFVVAGRPVAVRNGGESTLSSLNVSDGDVLIVVAVPDAGAAGGGARQQASQPAAAPESDNRSTAEQLAEESQRLLRQWSADGDFRRRVEHGMPELAAALATGNQSQVVELLTRLTAERTAERERIGRALANPMSEEAQRIIEQQIRRDNIDREIEHAVEHMPEVFGSVVMLYIDCRVNGHHLKAFVDSGAQTTIMSRACAERCGIMRLVDERYSGTAVGVGTQKIIGRIHVAQLQIETAYLPTSFCILDEQPMDVLLGLDMLRRHQCSIDLKDNMLKIGDTGVHTAFLPESEVPASARHHGTDDGHMESETAAGTEQAASSAAPVSNGAPAPAAATGDEPKLAQLAAMGYRDREEAVKQLQLADGDVLKAAVALAVRAMSQPPAV